MGGIQKNGPSGQEQEHGGPKPALDIAIVGGGIIGVITALGLLHRGMRVVIYERAARFQEIGAAIAFTGVAQECMEHVSPRVLEALKKVGQTSPNDKVHYWDGFTPRTKEAAEHESSLLFDVPERHLAFMACLRSHLLDGMTEKLPEGTVQFGKQLIDYTDDDASNKVALRFDDGSTAEADVG